MRVKWAGIYPTSPAYDNLETAPSGAITEVDLSGIADRHDQAVWIEWATVEEPEDHPLLGTFAYLVNPDGQAEPLGGGGFGGWGESGSGMAIQALAFKVDGAYSVEIRPFQMPDYSQGQPSVESLLKLDPAGERRLAILPLYVTGTTPS